MKKAVFRFYEELNDFLPVDKRKSYIEKEFWGSASVKDMIQSFNVPHTEVDLILVNGKSVDFDYTVSNNDKISVYPVFETFDISEVQRLRPEPLREPKFILDVHLGKLARSLRLLGIDALYQNDFEDEQIVTIAAVQKRCILTRDIGILKRSEADRGYWLRSADPEIQVVEIINRFQLKGKLKEFSRCISCNGELKTIDKKEVKAKVPENSYLSYEKFYGCENCDKIYWKGSHYSNMIKNINGIREKIL